MKFNEISHNSMKCLISQIYEIPHLQTLTIVSFWQLFWRHPSPRNAWKSQKYAELHGFYIISRKIRKTTEIHNFL